MKAAAKKKKQTISKTKQLASKNTAKVETLAKNVQKPNVRAILIKGLAFALLSLVAAVAVGVVVKQVINKKNEQLPLGSADIEQDVVNKDYEQASLDELEDALLKVENQIEEVTEAIENAKK